ncbi:MAG: hypothetical protein AAF219_07055 [Myxococcota bacterium]
MSTEKISVVELRAAAEKLFAHLEDSGNSDLEIDVDYYWHVPAEARYDMNHEPADLTVGQLSSDVDEILRLSRGELEPLNFGLVRLATVLQRIGETTIG